MCMAKFPLLAQDFRHRISFPKRRWTQGGHKRKAPPVGQGLLTQVSVFFGLFGEPGWDRTNDLLIKSQLLYH